MLFLVHVRRVGDDRLCQRSIVILRPMREVAISSEKSLKSRYGSLELSYV